MPLWFVYALVGIVVASGVGRVATRRWPRPTASGPTSLDAGFVVLGGVALAYHCGAMFFASSFRGALGLGGLSRAINDLGAASMIAFTAPCLVLLFGLRRTPRWFIASVAAVLVFVGITMYDGGSVDVHLTAIMLAAATIIPGAAFLTPSPGGGDGGSSRRRLSANS